MIMNFLKKYFIAHKGNQYRPHLFREFSVFVLLSLVLVLFIASVSGRIILQGSNLTALVLPKVLVDYANEDRLAGNYKTLAINDTLQKAAQLKASDMAAKSYFAHQSPDGHDP